jgi:DNA-binding Xre family transcriptional regulator
MRVRLRETLERYYERTGRRLSYEDLAVLSGLSKASIESIATRTHYLPSLSAVERLCLALGCDPGELLEIAEKKGPKGGYKCT